MNCLRGFFALETFSLRYKVGTVNNFIVPLGPGLAQRQGATRHIVVLVSIRDYYSLLRFQKQNIPYHLEYYI